MEILQLMNSNRYMEMTVVFPVPHIYFGKISCYRGDQPEDPFFILNGVTIQGFFLKSELHQLSLIKGNRKNVFRGIPELLYTIIYKRHMFFIVFLDHNS